MTQAPVCEVDSRSIPVSSWAEEEKRVLALVAAGDANAALERLKRLLQSHPGAKEAYLVAGALLWSSARPRKRLRFSTKPSASRFPTPSIGVTRTRSFCSRCTLRCRPTEPVVWHEQSGPLLPLFVRKTIANHGLDVPSP